MEVSFGEGTPLAFWYDTWLVVAGFAVALLLAVVVVARSGWGMGGLLLKTLMTVAVLAALPLTLARLGIGIAVGDANAIGYLNLAAVAGAVVVGVPYLWRQSRGEREPAAGGITPAEGVPAVPEPEGATRTLGAGGQETGTEAGAPGAVAPTAWLLFRSGPNVGQSIPLAPGSTRVGRSSDNDVVIDDPTVSRHHARISYREGRYVMEDVGSSTGTLVEGAPAAGAALMSGATIRVGETELVFMQGAPAAAGPGQATGAPAARPGETVVLGGPERVLAWLAVTGGPDKGKTYQLKAGDTTIGRDRGNDVVMADAAVSRRHALVRHQEGRLILLDLGSSGGTRVNGQPVGGRTVGSGGVITVGQTRLAVVDVEAQEAPQPAATEGATMVAQPAAAGCVLVARSGPDAGKSFVLGPGDTTLGREPECQVVLTDPAVSRRHALVRRQGDSWAVHDLGSRAGTMVDGEPVTGAGLSPGDTIALGRTEMVLMQPAQAGR